MSDELSLMAIDDHERAVSDLMIDWMALSEGLPDGEADWLPFLVFGVPYVQIAKIFGIHKSTITKALNNHPDFARRVAQGRKMVKRQLHYLWLDQKAVMAWQGVDYYLSLDPFEKDENGEYVNEVGVRRVMFQEKAKMVRFVLQQLGLHVQRHEVTHHTPQPMFMGDSSVAEIVVERVRAIMSGDDERDVDVIAGEYRDLIGADESELKEYEVSDIEDETAERPYQRKSPRHDVWQNVE